MDNNVEKSEAAQKLDLMRHSTAHVMAEAVQSMFPDAKFGIGPTIEDGFYYDFDTTFSGSYRYRNFSYSACGKKFNFKSRTARIQ